MVDFVGVRQVVSALVRAASIDGVLPPINIGSGDLVHAVAHGQRVRTQPRKLLRAVPGLEFREMPMSDLCCGSAGIYNVLQNEMAMTVLKSILAVLSQALPLF